MISLWTLNSAISAFVFNSELHIRLHRIRWIPIMIMPVFWLWFAVAYTGYDDYLSPSTIALVCVIPLVSIGLLLTNPMHRLLWDIAIGEHLQWTEDGEETVTVDGETHALPDPFTVIATQNTVERDRTYQLPMAELDRFMKKLHLGYPDEAEETQVLERMVGHHPIDDLEAVATDVEVAEARDAVAEVRVEHAVREYVTRLAGYTREHAQLGASPRASIALLRAAQARAVLDGRDYVVPDDVQEEAVVTLAHRIRPTPSADQTGRSVVEDALDSVRV